MSFGFETTAEEVTEGLDLTGKTFLVTGSNSGLGKESVRVLALRGAQVIAAARTEAKAAGALADLGVQGQAVACDLADLRSVRAAVDTLKSSKLDGLIANAGVMALQDHETLNGIEKQYFVNHVGHFALVTGLQHTLTAKGRVVMLSSGAHRMAPDAGIDFAGLSSAQDYSPWKAYGQSKLANLLFARELARRLPKGRTANSVHPGVIDTNLGRHIPDKEAMYARFKNIKSIAQGTATQLYVAVHPSVGGLTGAYFSDCKQAKTLHGEARNDALAAQLWDHTEQLLRTL